MRDVAVLAALRGDGATTVASTAHLAAAVGISVFATGGLGGVHRGARDNWDESADLMTLSRTPVLVVCAGVKSILDVGATLERLESLNVGVIGYRTDRFPGFYLADSGHPVGWRVETPGQVADVLRARRRLGTDSYGLVLANPIAPADEMDRALHDRVLADALAAAETAGVHGKDVTPFLLDFFHRETHGASLSANIALVLSNARLAAEIAAAPLTSRCSRRLSAQPACGSTVFGRTATGRCGCRQRNTMSCNRCSTPSGPSPRRCRRRSGRWPLR